VEPGIYFIDSVTRLPKRALPLVICAGDENNLDDYRYVNAYPVSVLLKDEVFLSQEDLTIRDPKTGLPYVRAGVTLMVDEARTKRYRQAMMEHDPLDPRTEGVFVNVFRDGALSARRGARRMVKKASRRELPEMRQTYALLNRYRTFLFSFKHGDLAAQQQYETDIFTLADTFKNASSDLKVEIYDLLTKAVVEDVIGRQNKERLPLMLAAASRRTERLLWRLRSWEVTANKRATALSMLCDAVISETETNRIVIAQALSSYRLLKDEGEIDNKDNAVIFWRGCAKKLREFPVAPFQGWLHSAASRFERAASAIEKHDMSGLSQAAVELSVADGFLRLPRLQDLLDNVIEPFAELRELGGKMDLVERAELAKTLENVGNELTTTAQILDSYLTIKERDIVEAIGLIAGTLEAVTPSENMLLRDSHVDEIYKNLVAASRCLNPELGETSKP
jgi:hypothetical protein